MGVAMSELSTWTVKDTRDGSEHDCQAFSPNAAYRKACDDGFVPIINGKYAPRSRYIVILKQE
jgi:hypothetical protein